MAALVTRSCAKLAHHQHQALHKDLSMLPTACLIDQWDSEFLCLQIHYPAMFLVETGLKGALEPVTLSVPIL